jgi:curved DNA-binding protein CbpA
MPDRHNLLQAAQRIREINEGYEVLSDSESRAFAAHPWSAAGSTVVELIQLPRYDGHNLRSLFVKDP